MSLNKPQTQTTVLSATTQNMLQSYLKRLQDDMQAMYDNFNEITKAARIDDSTQVTSSTQYLHDNYQMKVRAANIVRAGNSLMMLISELKTFLILNDFPQVNKHVNDQNKLLEAVQKGVYGNMVLLGDDVVQVNNDLASVYAATAWKSS